MPSGMIRTILSSAPAKALRRRARDLYWGLAGARIRNPRLPGRPRSLLFVCYGNICRSPFAEYLGRQKQSGRADGGLACDSAGLRAKDGTGPPDGAIQAARDWRVDLRPHRSKSIDREMLDKHGMILVMEAWQLTELRRAHPDRHDRLFLLPLLEAELSGRGRGYARYNLADPYGRDLEGYRACFREIDRSLDLLFDALSGERRAISGQPSRIEPGKAD